MSRYQNASRIVSLMAMRGSTIMVKFGLSVFLAKFAGLEVLGAYGLIVAMTLAFPVIARAGLMNALSRELVDAPREQVSRDLSHYLVWVAAVYTALLPVAWMIDAAGWFPALAGLGLLIWAIVLLEHLAVDAVVLLNTRRKPGLANAFGLAQAALWSVPYMAAAYVLPELRSIEALLWFWICGTVAGLAGLSPLLRPFRAGWPALDWRTLAKQLGGARFLFLTDAVGALGQYADRFIVAAAMGLEVAGIYTIYSQVVVAAFTLTNSSIMQMRRPDLIACFRDGRLGEGMAHWKALLREAMAAYTAIVAAGGTALWLLADIISEPSLAENLLLFVLLGVGFGAKIVSWIVFLQAHAQRRDRELLVLGVLSTSAYVGLALALTRFETALGVPAAMLVSSLAAIAVHEAWLAPAWRKQAA